MAYRVFKRRWWKDAKCTVPGAGRKMTVRIVDTEEDARLWCRGFNYDEDGKRIERPYGVAFEYETA